MVADSATTLVSLFAGAGGLDLGLEQAGFSTVVATDSAPHACETLRQNKVLGSMESGGFESWFDGQLQQRCYRRASDALINTLRHRVARGVGRHQYLAHATILERDIRHLDATAVAEASRVKRGELTLVAGGPPCQSFSRAGKRETVDATDGQLFMEFVRVVDGLRPRFVLFENVKGLVQSRTTIWYAKCARCGEEWFPPFESSRVEPDPGSRSPDCSHCSSGTRWMVEKAIAGGSLDLILAEFERIGYSLQWRLLNAADYGAPQTRERLFIVGSRDGEPIHWPRPTHVRPVEDVDGAQLQIIDASPSAPHWLGIKDVLWVDGHAEFGQLAERAVLWVKNVVRPHDEPVTWPLTRPCPTVGAHQAAKFAIAPEGVPEEQLRRQQWHVLGRRQGDRPPVPVEHAYLSDEELLTLQTFPSWWYLYGTRMERAFQIGNAVPPLFGRLIGEAILESAGELTTAATVALA